MTSCLAYPSIVMLLPTNPVLSSLRRTLIPCSRICSCVEQTWTQVDMYHRMVLRLEAYLNSADPSLVRGEFEGHTGAVPEKVTPLRLPPSSRSTPPWLFCMDTRSRVCLGPYVGQAHNVDTQIVVQVCTEVGGSRLTNGSGITPTTYD